MLDVAVQRESGWPDLDWDAIGVQAAAAAVAQTPFGGLADAEAVIEIAVRLTDDAEVHQLNAQYRGKDKPTNVLSFPMIEPDLIAVLTQNSDDGEVILGDIVLAHGVCAAEAQEKGFTVEQHATHLIVHGVLHLLGYDHQGDSEAEAMESMERAALETLGIPDPYLVRED
ncbi:rRNA maturation RNase YbeY [Sphingomonas koreensis]|jgi:probable rRNA maturation factor|uniref:Endoribonuclease YbeY n=1 Tax=Sphingomonas koreensis TaxID=93064 RepID=A0A1L6J8J7_9SPHN|nr:rRNA maturation RNase YbeY [Sphingomonas koreensis]APR52225.1 rRNA maturation RNase YbeY [Sphingomonas koreensis]MDC7812942.1 rRNA maturation RNase YbeY [Sphingomonas koreensis]RSU17161.1 rRNA maturation RNase YbeY [Sphingomonas koreensis]RSU19445.1 rRNA maturation RNase YbeY [Sphingomonas koreensis]RSU20691.1 rRNA maturation RNase YbeY [Sphingomonas koreensis]